MAGILQTFPNEVLSQIFTAAETFAESPLSIAVILSHVCHQWRHAALGDSSLWLQIGLCHRDIDHTPIVAQMLRRSKERKIGIGLDFRSLRNPDDIGLESFGKLLRLVRGHLWRTCHLFIYAQWHTWRMITAVFGTQAYPNLTLLDAELVIPQAHRGRPWTLRIDGNGEQDLSAVRPAPNVPIVFPIPRNHPKLDKLRLNGISMGNTPVPNVTLVRISGMDTPNLIAPDGRLNRWLLDGPNSVFFEDMPVPPMPLYVPYDANDRPTSTVKHLILSGLSAYPRTPGPEGRREHSCLPFFDSLYTPYLRCLQIDRWDLGGRAWPDFLMWLPEDIRFPRVTDLRIIGMHFLGMDYAGLAFFLASFPSTRHLKLQDCWPGTWECVLEVLQLNPTLCPGVKSIRLGNGAMILRNDPLPFAAEYVRKGDVKLLVSIRY